MKILIAGLGSIGRRHLRNLLALGERDLVLFRTHRSTLPEDELTGFPVETELEAALAHKPQAVIVSNPTALHLDVAIPAARAGCHLLIEKPLSHSRDGISELQQAVQGSGSRVLMGYHFRHHPNIQNARQLLAEGQIGKPLSLRAHWGEYLPGWHPWEDYRQSYSALAVLGGGVVLTLSHPLDYLRWLCGEVRCLWAFASKVSDLEIDVEDSAEIGLQFQNGLLGSVHLDYYQRPPAHRLEIIGTRGTLSWDNGDGALTMQIGSTKNGATQTQRFPVPEGFERNTLFLEEIRHFLAVTRGEEQPLCTLSDGIWALELALATLESAKNGCLIKFSSGDDLVLH